MIMNRRIRNPHMRIEFVSFIQYLLPNKKAGNERPLYKHDFFNNPALKKYLMHALIIVYIDSEKTEYYGKFGFRHAAASIMEFIWTDKEYQT